MLQVGRGEVRMIDSIDCRIHPISILTFLTATRYAELLFSTGVFASGQIVVCTQGFFYDLPSDPHLRLSSAVVMNMPSDA